MKKNFILCKIFGPVKVVNREIVVIALESNDNRIVLVPIPKVVIENFVSIFLDEVVPVTPLLIDFIAEKLMEFEKIPGQKVEALYIYQSKMNYLYAEFRFEDTHRRELRPEDALAIAARIGCPILVEEDLLIENILNSSPYKNEQAISEAKGRQDNIPDDFEEILLFKGWKKQ